MSSINLRRLRQNEHVRAMTREVQVRLEQLVQPLFVAERPTGDIGRPFQLSSEFQPP